MPIACNQARAFCPQLSRATNQNGNKRVLAKGMVLYVGNLLLRGSTAGT